jgi:hypothetical protein
VTLNETAVVVSRWAATEPLIRRAYLFGSRVKGTARPDSDLDVAIVHEIDPALRGIGETLRLDRQFTWEDHSPRWRDDLGKLLPMPLDLNGMETGTAVLRPALKAARLCVYQRGRCSVKPP